MMHTPLSARSFRHYHQVTMYVSGIMVEKTLVLFAEAGVVAPTAKNLEDMLEKVKGAAQYLSEEELCENRKESIKACREMPGYKGDIKWTYDNGVKHSEARNARCHRDGCGW
jgi:hypothetical protein